MNEMILLWKFFLNEKIDFFNEISNKKYDLNAVITCYYLCYEKSSKFLFLIIIIVNVVK